MALYGGNVSNPNYILRFAVLIFMGVISMASVLFWRSQLLFASEYQEMPVTHEQIKIRNENKAIQKKIAEKLMGSQTEEPN